MAAESVKALLDTHAFLWWLFDSSRLSARARELFSDDDSTLFLSAASTWEMAIKASLGKLRLPSPVDALVASELRRQRLLPLGVEHTHAARVETLAHHHRDPFDRLLIAQALTERIPVVTADKRFRKYGVGVIW